MRSWFLYTPWCLILIHDCLKFLNQPNIFQSLIWRPNHIQRDEGYRPQRSKPILNHPLPMTLRQLRRVLGITGYGCIWILGYVELARPLHKLITETQQAQTDKLVWSWDTDKALKALQTALLQAPALSLPTGSEFNLSLKEKVWPWEFWHIPKGLTSSE